jgi:hypothetical protein
MILSTTPFLTILLQTTNQTHGYGLNMHKVTKSSSITGIFIEISTACFSKICHGAEFYFHFTAIVIPSIEDVECVSCFFFIGVFDVDVSYYVIA